MFTFFAFVRAVRAAYKAIRAAVGIMIIAHGAYKWVQLKQGA